MKLLNYSLCLLLSLWILNSCQEKRSIDHPFCHHVYFWLNNPDDPADRTAFENGISELLKIPEIKSYHIGIPAQTGHREVVDGSYTYSYMVFFENEQGHDVYQQHPIHVKFVEDCQHLWNRVVVYDSVLK
jgi:hypothetical protein